MRRKDKEITDHHIIEQILKESHICRLGIADTPVPYIVPLNYGYHDHHLYFHSASQGKKIELLKLLPDVSFEIENGYAVIKNEWSCKWTARYRCIMGQGKIEILTAKDDIRKGLDIIMNHHGKLDNSYDEDYFDRIVILRMSIIQLSAKQSGDW